MKELKDFEMEKYIFVTYNNKLSNHFPQCFEIGKGVKILVSTAESSLSMNKRGWMPDIFLYACVFKILLKTFQC